MANSKTNTKNYQNVEILWPKKTWEKNVGGPLWDKEKKQKIEGSVPGRRRRFLPPITPHKERCNYIYIAEYGKARVRLPVLHVVNFYLFIFISLIADGPHHYHPAHGH